MIEEKRPETFNPAEEVDLDQGEQQADTDCSPSRGDLEDVPTSPVESASGGGDSGIQATVEAGGAVAQGQGAKAVAERGVQTDGDVDGSVIAGDVDTRADFVGRDKVSIRNHYKFVTESREGEADHRIKLVDVVTETVEKARQLFVEPPGYLRFIGRHRSLEHRVLLINGPEHTDKFGCAVAVGVDLFQSEDLPEFYIYQRRATSSHTLLDFVNYEGLPKNAIFILEDAFETGLGLSDLPEKFVATISHKLRERACLLILTSSYPDERIAELTAVDHLNARVADPRDVLRKYLEYYRELNGHQLPETLVKLAERNETELIHKLPSRLQIEQFCIQLSHLTIESGSNVEDEDSRVKKMIALADRVGNTSQERLRQWFGRLSLNQKLFAMLVVLMPNLGFLSLTEFYVEAVKRLLDRKQADTDVVLAFHDPREEGVLEILSSINAVETASLQIQFTSPAYRREVRRQIRSYYPLLWSLVDLILEFVDFFKRAEHWELRRELGRAIGIIGVEHRSRLTELLSRIAASDYRGVQVVAGYALAEIGKSKRHHQFVTDLLSGWAKSGQVKLMWTAAASVWRVYGNIAEELPPTESIRNGPVAETEEHFDPLSELARLLTYLARTSADDDVLGSVIHAIRMVARNHAAHMVDVIQVWLNSDESEQLSLMGRVAAFDLFSENRRLDVPPTRRQHQPLLALVRSLLASEREMLELVMSRLLMWMADNEWEVIIHQSFLDIANRASDLEHSALRNSIVQYWMTSENGAAKEVGQALLVRSYVMQGYPVDLPGHRSILLILDNSRAARKRSQNADLGRWLYHNMLAWSDLTVAQLGRTEHLLDTKDSSAMSWSDPFTQHRTPRLVYPPLEGILDGTSTHIAVLVSWGAVADYEDTLSCAVEIPICVLAIENEATWSESLLLSEAIDASREFARELHEPLTVLKLPSFNDGTGHDSVLVWLHSQIARNLSQRQSDVWWRIIGPQFEQQPDSLAGVRNALDRWISILTEAQSNVFPDDPARLAADTVLWLAADNLEQCVQLLSGWVAENDTQQGARSSSAKQSLGTACIKMLCDLYGPYATELSSEKALALFQVLPFLTTTCDPSLIKTFLTAVRHWLTIDSFRDKLLDTDSAMLQDLTALLRRPETAHELDEMLRILQGWKRPLKERGEEETPQTTSDLAEHLSFHLFITDSLRLPPLEDNQKYAFVVLDASGSDNPVRRHFARVASSVVEKLRERTQRLVILVFHMGSMYPIPIPDGDIEVDKLLPYHMEHRPRLLAPILEQTSVDRVRFVLLLTGGAVLDQADWEQEWRNVVSVYSVGRNIPWCGDLVVDSHSAQPNMESPAVVESVAEMIISELDKLGVE